jgi:NAD(P)-dependent dehydrogenase (short-subunit alcohol dehydrogenase family)
MSTTRDFSGMRVAVTGAAGGIGREICRQLLESGATVYGLDVAPEGKVPVGVIPFAVDITSADSIAEVVGAIYAEGEGAVNLVTAAGVVEDDVPAEEMSVGQFQGILAVNLVGVFLTCQAFGRELMARGGGAIVNIASMSGTQVVNLPQHQVAYNVSKAGVAALTRTLAVEWGARGVRVNAVSPGYVNTPLLSLKKHQFTEWKRKIATDRFAEPHEVAATILFLLSDEAAYFHGSDVLMDGGYSLT